MAATIVELQSLAQQGIEVFASLTEAQLKQHGRTTAQAGLFIAESPKVIERALDAGCQPVALLCERRHIEGDARAIVERCSGIPVYTGDRQLLASLTGYTLTRGVLCAMRRPELPEVGEVCQQASRVAVIDGVSDATNIGAIFRSAAALGIDGVLLTSATCDPLNRRAVRVSMGNVFHLPWTWLSEPISSLANYGLRTAAMALTDRSISLDAPELAAEPRLAIVVGEEGYGLAQDVIDAADYTVRIPMARGVDSLNVATAAAIAFWELRKKPV